MRVNDERRIDFSEITDHLLREKILSCFGRSDIYGDIEFYAIFELLTNT